MDTLYTGDIPSQYKYAQFGSNYIDLYNSSVLQPNHTYTYYRVYLYDNIFIYDIGVNVRGNYSNSITLRELNTTDNFRYRRDFSDICLTVFMYILLFVFLINIVTSSIKKGGLLGGLL